MKRINTLFFSRLFLSFGAVLLTFSAQIQLGIEPQWHPYLLLVFFAVLIEYNRNGIIEILFPGEKRNAKRPHWMYKNQKVLLSISLVLIALLLIVAWLTKPKVLFIFMALGILTFFYSMPLLSKRDSFFKLRKIPYLKIFLIVFVWSALTIFLPAAQSGKQILSMEVELLFCERFFFIFAIAIPFDIRDMRTDRDAGLKTIPLLISQKNAWALSYISLLASFIIAAFHYYIQKKGFIIEALSVSLLSTFLYLNLNSIKNKSKFYYSILDSTLLWQALLVLGFYYFAHSHL